MTYALQQAMEGAEPSENDNINDGADPNPAPDEGQVQNQDQGQDPSAADGEPSVEDKARALGWVPPEEFRGDNPVTAEEFVKKGENNLPMMQENLNSLAKRNKQMERQIEELSASHMAALKSQRESIIEDLKKQQREAVEEGDVAAFDKLEEKKAEVMKQPVQPKPARKPEEFTPEEVQAVQGFQDQNSYWYVRDNYLRGEAGLAFNSIKANNPHMTAEQHMQELHNYMHRNYAEDIAKYPVPPRLQNQGQQQPVNNRPAPNRLPRVNGSGNRSPKTPAPKTFKDLPEDAQIACKQLVGMGKMTQEEYIKSYFGS
jgi:hypothetical protein